MQLRALPAEEAAVRRYVEELWLPYHRDLEAAVANHALADDIDLVEAEVEFRLDLVDSDDYRLWVAIDGTSSGGDGEDESDVAAPEITDPDADLVGFVATNVDEAPTVFDRPDRLILGDIYVRESYRGSGLARELVDRAAARAREAGCPELVLDVDADNERALAFYEKLGFETFRHQMTVGVEEL